MGIKEQTLVCLMDINKNLSELVNEFKKFNANESKKQKTMKETVANNNARAEQNKTEAEALREEFVEYYFGAQGGKSGN